MAKVLIGNIKGPKGDMGDQGPQGVQGPTGAMGPQGADGPTGTRGSRWTQGTAITGTSASATIFSDSGINDALVNDNYLNTSTGDTYRCVAAGDASEAKWVYTGNIKGPKGETGPQGATGPKGDTGEVGPAGATGNTGVSMRLRNAWESGTKYVNNANYIDIVTYNGSTYACRVSHTASNSILPTDTTYWQLIAQKGDSGETGDIGSTTANYTSDDTATPSSWKNFALFTGLEKVKEFFAKASAMASNIRWLYKMLGTTDISAIGDGTVTGVLSELNGKLTGTLLWENPNPMGIEFPSKTIKLLTDEYDIYTVFYNASGVSYGDSKTSFKGIGIPLYYITFGSGNVVNIIRRSVEYVDDKTLLITDANYHASSGSNATSNNYCVPYKIIGYKL